MLNLSLLRYHNAFVSIFKAIVNAIELNFDVFLNDFLLILDFLSQLVYVWQSLLTFFPSGVHFIINVSLEIALPFSSCLLHWNNMMQCPRVRLLIDTVLTDQIATALAIVSQRLRMQCAERHRLWKLYILIIVITYKWCLTN